MRLEYKVTSWIAVDFNEDIDENELIEKLKNTYDPQDAIGRGISST